MKFLSPSILIVSIWLSSFVNVQAQAPVPAKIAFSEIMYNGPETNNDTLEFLELYNYGSYVVNMQNYAITNGIEHIFDALLFYPGQYLILAQNSTAFFNTFGMNVIQWDSGRLGNTGEQITLTNNNGVVVDDVTYGVSAPWPSLPNGQGPSLTLCNPWTDNANAANWSAATNAAAVNGAGQTIFADPLMGCPSWSGGPIANFYSDENNILSGANLTFHDVSVGIPTSWVWSFPGGTPSASVLQQPPTITYPTAGSYQVCLTVTSNQGTHQHCESNYVVVANPPDVNLMITEIMYNPVGTIDSLEYIELHNSGTDTANLEGYSFSQGVEYIFPAVNIVPDGYVVIAVNAQAIQNTFGLDALQWSGGILINSGEAIVLNDENGNIVDSVNYGNDAPWPLAANGTGPSLVLCDPTLDNSLPTSWIAATEEAGINALNQIIYGTPGGSCLNTVPTPGFAASLTTVLAGTSVYFTNLALGYTSAYHWTFDGGAPPESYTENPIVAYNTPGSYKVCQRVSNIYGADSLCIEGYITVNTNPLPQVVISEIMYNPPESADSLEYIELYNRSSDTLFLNGFRFTAGISHIFSEEFITPGGFLVVAKNVQAIANTFGITAIGWNSGSLNNEGELIELKDSFNRVVDTVHYLNTLPWAPEPDGDGPSLVLCDPTLDNSLGANWIRSIELAAQNQAGEDIFGTPGAPCSFVIPSPNFSASQTSIPVNGQVLFTDASNGYVSTREWIFNGGTPTQSNMANQIVSYNTAGDYKVCLKAANVYGADSLCREAYIHVGEGMGQRVVISEIMYNSPDIDTDSLEFIELYNNTSETIDLTNYRFTAGVEYTFPETQIEAGHYLVVARDSAKANNFYGVECHQWTSGFLQNSGEVIKLIDNLGLHADSVHYGIATPWDPQANGLGPSLVLCNPSSNNALGESWQHSFDTVGQIANGKYVMANPRKGCDLNLPQIDFLATNPSLFTSETTDFYDLTSSHPLSWKWYFEGALPETSTDQNPTGIIYTTAGEYKVCLKAVNAIGSDSLCRDKYITVTAGGTAKLAISEIMYNPPDVIEDTLEYVEITNIDSHAYDLYGFKFTKGIGFEFPHHQIDPGQKVVVSRNSQVLETLSGATSFEWDGGGVLSNIGEMIVLTDRLGYGIDSVDYRPQSPWPAEANGTGRALTLCDPTLDNNDPLNWIAAYDICGFKANGDTLWGTPGTGCGPGAPIVRIGSSTTQIPVNEPVQYYTIDLGWPSTWWLWVFQGSDTDTSYLQNPVITYPLKGYYSALLQSANEFGSASYYGSLYMNVTEAQGIDDHLNPFTIYPNPSSGKFQVTTSIESARVTIYNLIGQKLEEKVAEKTSVRFDLTEAPVGMYFIEVTSAQGIRYVSKILIGR